MNLQKVVNKQKIKIDDLVNQTKELKLEQKGLKKINEASTKSLAEYRKDLKKAESDFDDLKKENADLKANEGFTKEIVDLESNCENIAKSKAYIERDPIQRRNFTCLKNIIHHMNEINRLQKIVE